MRDAGGAECACGRASGRAGVAHLLFDLGDGAEDVAVVLLEAAHAREARERAGELVPVEHAEVGKAQRQLAVRALAVLEHEAVGGAVHWLEAELLALDLEAEHVLLVLGGVARRLPQLEVEHVGRDHFVVVALPVLLADEVLQPVVEARAVRQEEARARAELVEVEELLLEADLAVVALGRLLLEVLPLGELLLVGEGDAVDPL
jgi:hypothetical protein